jgi:aspartate/methionine/tyrosine aminotransferase
VQRAGDLRPFRAGAIGSLFVRAVVSGTLHRDIKRFPGRQASADVLPRRFRNNSGKIMPQTATFPLAARIEHLGSETAFNVSAEASKLAATGRKVYPFHLGDLNIRTPQNIIDAAFRAANAGKTGYCSFYGIPELREALADDVSRTHEIPLTIDNVVIQPGGKPTIGKFVLALMNPGDEVLYPNPGYPIYESQIEFHGGRAKPYGFVEGEKNFEIDFDSLQRQITSRTRLLIYNNLHNPTSAESSDEEMRSIAELAIKHDLIVLADEAYFEIRYAGTSTSIASLPEMQSRTVILYTFSKKFAMTGWRLGASIGPKEIIYCVARLNVNDESCSNHFIQYGALEGLRGDPSGPREIINRLRARRDRIVPLLNAIPGIRCYKPDATFYVYPNVTELMRRKGIAEYEPFRREVLQQTGVAFCSRIHFGRELPGERDKYLRFAYSGIDVDDIEQGLQAFTQWAKA